MSANTFTAQGSQSALNIASATTLKAGIGRVCKVIVNTAGSSGGTVSDCLAGNVAASNLVFNIPNTVGVYDVQFPVFTGLTITPGSSQVVSVSYE